MSIQAKIILDSVSPLSGVRLTTMELTYPRFIHAEFMTHRMFSRNAASSRAIPTQKMIQMVLDNPAMPVYWGKNKRGMSANREISSIDKAKELWLQARDEAVDHANWLYELGVHKQIVNRIIEPWKHITVICTATQWSNFFALRRHEDAQPEIHELANRMYKALEDSTPTKPYHDWHMPYIDDEDIRIAEAGGPNHDLRNISVARCARVSYLTHDGRRDHEADLRLFNRLLKGSGHGHWSPFEHVAEIHHDPKHMSGNIHGWTQYRKTFMGECL